MEKRIKLYCVILSAIYLSVIIYSVYSEAPDFKAGFEMGVKSAEKNMDIDFYHVKVKPKSGEYYFPDSIINVLTGKTLHTSSGEYKFLMEDSNLQNGIGEKIMKVFRGILALFVIIAVIVIPFLFFSIIRSAMRGDLLNKRIIRKVSILGWMLVFIYLYTLLFYSIAGTYFAKQVIELKNYDIVTDFSDYSLLILGVVTLLLSEILKVSLRMKEEQDLTI